jgi:hypothetical protein
VAVFRDLAPRDLAARQDRKKNACITGAPKSHQQKKQAVEDRLQ